MSFLRSVRLTGEAAAGVVTLDMVAQNPAIVESLGLEELRPLIALLEMAQGALRARWFVVSTEAALKPAPPAEEPDRLLKVKQAAMRIGVAVDTLYRNADDYPFTVRTEQPRALRFSERGITDWMKAKRGK